MVYEDSTTRLICGDCRQVLRTIAPRSVDLLLTDVPYGISQEGMSNRGPGGSRNLDFFDEDRSALDCEDLLLEVLPLVVPLLTDAASCYLWTGHVLFGSAEAWLRIHGWTTRPIVWHKPAAPPAMPGSGWSSCVELGVYAYRPGRTWNHHVNAPRNLIVADVPRAGRIHPTEKPLALIEELLRASSHPGDLVLDPFAGSASTLVACRALGRRSVGIELSEEFCRRSVERLAQATLATVEPHDDRDEQVGLWGASR